VSRAARHAAAAQHIPPRSTRGGNPTNRPPRLSTRPAWRTSAAPGRTSTVHPDRVPASRRAAAHAAGSGGESPMGALW
jgi:hypothetical protein